MLVNDPRMQAQGFIERQRRAETQRDGETAKSHRSTATGNQNVTEAKRHQKDTETTKQSRQRDTQSDARAGTKAKRLKLVQTPDYTLSLLQLGPDA